jgi:lysophospholipase L1-like esterase
MVMNGLDADSGRMQSLTLYGDLGYRINLIVWWRGFWRLFPVATVFLVLLGMPAQAREIKLLAFGDSLTAGYGLPNDGLRGLDPKMTHENLDAILSRLAALGIPVLFAGMKAPPNLGEGYGREYRAVFSDLSARYDVVFYPFFLEGVAGKPALNQDDGIHPNPKGVATVVARILPAARELLALVR